MFLEIDEIAPTQTHPVFHPAIELYHADQPVEAMNAAFKAVRQMPDNDSLRRRTGCCWATLLRSAVLASAAARHIKWVTALSQTIGNWRLFTLGSFRPEVKVPNACG